MSLMEQLIRIPLSVLTPPVCQVCGGRSGGKPVCDSCLEKLEGLRLPVSSFEPINSVLEAIYAPYRFDSVAADIVHLFKYSGLKSMGKLMARKMSEVIDGERFDCIAEVPLFAARRRERGFSQTLLLAIWISELSGIKHRRLLVRTRYTPPQARIKDHSRRFANVKNAFALNVSPNEVENRRILLVDDVSTTGATLNEAAMPLVEAGAASVSAVVFAVAG